MDGKRSLRTLQYVGRENKCNKEISHTVLSTSFGKTFLAWLFILNENALFLLTVSYQELFFFWFLRFIFKYLL